jgi:hypothetical protein
MAISDVTLAQEAQLMGSPAELFQSSVPKNELRMPDNQQGFKAEWNGSQWELKAQAADTRIAPPLFGDLATASSTKKVDANADSIARLKSELAKIDLELQEKQRLEELEHQELLRLEKNLQQLNLIDVNVPAGAPFTIPTSQVLPGVFNVAAAVIGGGAGYLIQRGQDAALTNEKKKLVTDLKEKNMNVQATLDKEQQTVRELKSQIGKLVQDHDAVRRAAEARAAAESELQALRYELDTARNLISKLDSLKSSQIEELVALVSELKISLASAERKAKDAATTTDTVKAQLAEANDKYSKRLSAAASSAELAEARRIAAEKK